MHEAETLAVLGGRRLDHARVANPLHRIVHLLRGRGELVVQGGKTQLLVGLLAHRHAVRGVAARVHRRRHHRTDTLRDLLDRLDRVLRVARGDHDPRVEHLRDARRSDPGVKAHALVRLL